MPPSSALSVEPEWVHAVFDLLGREDKSIEEIESEVLLMVPDAMTARRLIDWIPEVVALVIVGHISDVKLPNTFSATTPKVGALNSNSILSRSLPLLLPSLPARSIPSANGTRFV